MANEAPGFLLIDVGGVKVGPGNLTLMAGPCAVENREILFEVAAAVKKAGAQILRAGAYVLEPVPTICMGEDGLKLLQEAGKAHGMPTVTEVRSVTHVEIACRYTELLQIGARNMQNFDLLREVGQSRKPVLLKRGLSATIKELLMAAEHILAAGNDQVILRARHPHFRNGHSLHARRFPGHSDLARRDTFADHLDPSHAAGRAALVPALMRAGVAAGADGMIVEVHSNPVEAMCDGGQVYCLMSLLHWSRMCRKFTPSRSGEKW